MEQGFQVLLQVFGGLALFLYGTDSLCRAVQQGAGRRLRSLLSLIHISEPTRRS